MVGTPDSSPRGRPSATCPWEAPPACCAAVRTPQGPGSAGAPRAGDTQPGGALRKLNRRRCPSAWGSMARHLPLHTRPPRSSVGERHPSPPTPPTGQSLGQPGRPTCTSAGAKLENNPPGGPRTRPWALPRLPWARCLRNRASPAPPPSHAPPSSTSTTADAQGGARVALPAWAQGQPGSPHSPMGPSWGPQTACPTRAGTPQRLDIPGLLPCSLPAAHPRATSFQTMTTSPHWLRPPQRPILNITADDRACNEAEVQSHHTPPISRFRAPHRPPSPSPAEASLRPRGPWGAKSSSTRRKLSEPLTRTVLRSCLNTRSCVLHRFVSPTHKEGIFLHIKHYNYFGSPFQDGSVSRSTCEERQACGRERGGARAQSRRCVGGPERPPCKAPGRTWTRPRTRSQTRAAAQAGSGWVHRPSTGATRGDQR